MLADWLTGRDCQLADGDRMSQRPLKLEAQTSEDGGDGDNHEFLFALRISLVDCQRRRSENRTLPDGTIELCMLFIKVADAMIRNTHIICLHYIRHTQ
jgi:hypothetical protein